MVWVVYADDRGHKVQDTEQRMAAVHAHVMGMHLLVVTIRPFGAMDTMQAACKLVRDAYRPHKLPKSQFASDVNTASQINTVSA